MKKILFNLFLLSSHCLFAYDSSSSSAECQKCDLGSAGFLVTDSSLWYNIYVPFYPSSVLLSRNANRNFKEGEVSSKSTGLKINEAGNYSVSFSAVLQSNDPINTVYLPVFLVTNGNFNPMNINTFGSVAIIPVGNVGVVQGSGILHNVKEGTTLTLVATNTADPNAVPITVVNWSINAFKIPCESK